MPPTTSRKVILSLPEDLVAFVDVKAAERGTTRSHLVSELLEKLRQHERDALAGEGYRFYAQEAREFVEMSSGAVAEADTVLSFRPESALRERIEELAAKATEDELDDQERAEYEGYVRANKFVAVLQRQARQMLASEA